MPPKKKDVVEENLTPGQMLMKEMAGLKTASNLIKMADGFSADVPCTSTGFPKLDAILHEKNQGMPEGRDIEVYSKEPEVGKTTICLNIGAEWQKAGKKVLVIDVEDTITDSYCEECGLVTNQEATHVFPVLFVRHPEGKVLCGEDILNTISEVKDMFDLIIVDSIAALEEEANLEKNADEPDKMGGIAKMMNKHLKKNLKKKATVLWINQSRMKIGYNPTGNVQYTTSGGKAPGFFASIRLELSRVETIYPAKDKTKHPIGMEVQFYTYKNKVSPPFRKANMTCLFKGGFSVMYDYKDMAISAGIIEKKGAWFILPDGQKIQGDESVYHAMRDDPKLFAQIKALVDGEPVEEGVIDVSAA